MLPAPLLATLERERPASTLLVQPDQDETVGELPAELDRVDLNWATPEQILDETFIGRADLVYIRGDCLQCRKDSLMQLVAKCRDLLSSRVLIEMGPESVLEEADMLAMAFTRYAVTESSPHQEYRYFYFDLKTYKPVPDWLNPKFWANPQNWDKFRW